MLKKFLLIVVILFIAPAVFAQTTGKIIGVITDKATGEPLPGVNVIVVGTNLGSATDVDGYFVILNVPVGRYDVKSIYVGYKDVVVQGARVSVDHTTEVNFEVEATTLELEEAILVTAERELIRRDDTNTNIVTVAEDIETMPVRGIQELAALTAGVVKQDNSDIMNIRGGRGGESAIYIDGVLMNDPYNRSVRSEIPNEAIEEISVQTGGFSAEYGEAMSGIIASTIKSGSEKYTGMVQVITDEFLSSYNKEFGLDTYSYGYNEYLLTLSGPIYPGTKHTFYVSALRQYQADWWPSYGWAYNPDKSDAIPGLDPDPKNKFTNGTIPANNASIWNYTGKLKLQLMQNMDLKASAIYSNRVRSWTNPIYLYDPDHAPERADNTLSLNATLTHTISSKTFYDLKFNYFNTFDELYDRMFRDNLMQYGDPRYNPGDENDPLTWGTEYGGSIDPDYKNPYRAYDDYQKNRSTYYGISFDIMHQASKEHTLKMGIDYKYHTLRWYRMLWPYKLSTKGFEGQDTELISRYRAGDAQFFGYDMYGKEVDSGDYFSVTRNNQGVPLTNYDTQAPYNPITFSVYVQDKIELSDLVINLGFRYDRIDPNAWQFKQLEAEFDADGNYIAGTGMFGGNEQFDESDTKPSEAYDYISPRIGISFPVTASTKFHAQWGKFFQAPDLADLYLSPFYLDTWVFTGGYFTTLDNPNLKPPLTTSYEVGFSQQLASTAVLRLSAFYKEIEDHIQVRPIQTDVTNIAMTSNGDYGQVKGFDIMVTVRRIYNIQANFAYEMQSANGTGSTTQGNFDIAWQRGGKGNYPTFTMPLTFEQRHTGSLNLDYRLQKDQGPTLFGVKPLENFGTNLLFTFNSGRPYTRMVTYNTMPFSGRYDNDGISETPLSAINHEFTPWVSRFDLKLDRRFTTPLNTSLTLYLWVYNIFNQKNIMGVWQTTGLPDDIGYRGTTGGQDYWAKADEALKQNYKMRENDYFYYGMPRQIRLGARIEF
jgi:outer membrane receptor protein involved in Fe transport